MLITGTPVTTITDDTDISAEVLRNDETERFKQCAAIALSSLDSEKRRYVRAQYWGKLSAADTAALYGVPTERVASERAKAMRYMRSPDKIKMYRRTLRGTDFIDIIDQYAYAGSLSRWRETFTSSTERAAIAVALGGGVTEDGVRRRCDRFFSSQNKQKGGDI